MKQIFLIAFAAALTMARPAHAQLRADGATASFKGSLPPKPVADISSEQQSALERELADVTTAFQAVKKNPHAADAEIFIKAVRYALEFHEWYDKKADDGVKKAREELAEASRRIEALKQNKTPWMDGPGQKVLGFYSDIDNSPQPYGVEVPEGLKWGQGNKAVPMWIWLHGRGDTATDIHFIASRMKAKRGQFQPANAIVVHPFGRFCNGWKSAGETDVFECKEDATRRFNVDVNRIALAGFSMGGAGAWHLGAHFADQWAVVHTGAGFADVKRYQKLTPEKYPVWYEQKLWGMYDVPDYARNFLNVPLISYSGEIDAQRDSAEYMMEVLGKEGLHPPYLIGPGMPHKYHPDTLKELQGMIEKDVAKGRNPVPREVHLQARTQAYGHMYWVEIETLEQPWEDSRIDAKWTSTDAFEVRTHNIAIFRLHPELTEIHVTIDGQDLGRVHPMVKGYEWTFTKQNDRWVNSVLYRKDEGLKLNKMPGLQGPIDDAFKHRFILVVPDGPSSSPEVDAWVQRELSHFTTRWRGLMRGDPIVRKPSEIYEPSSGVGSPNFSMILWGNAKSNSLIAKVLPNLPLHWTDSTVSMGTQSFDSKTHVPVLCYPNPLHGQYRQYNNRYIVLNSGLTFREAHDKTNSLQNPKLPDWAILDITQPPNAESAGKVVAADFFDEHWQVKPDMPPVDSK